jgi:hypothetical protein
MKDAQPPKLAVALLHRLVSDEALVGDLLEEFEARRSPLWFWRQVLVTALIGLFHRNREIRPLRLVEADSTLVYPEPRAVRDNHPRTINLAASPRGAAVGGLGAVALGVLITLVAPQAWWLLLFGALGGVLLGIVMIVVGRHRVLSGPGSGSPGILFGHDTPERSQPPAPPGRR